MNDVAETFDANYYRCHCGDLPYLRSTPEWHNFFRPIADAIVLGLAPRKVFDAGCAVGFLVEMLWDRGVEAHGRDISEFAISEIRADVRPWCEVGSIAAPIEGHFDLVLCIEVVEHMPAEEALAAIRNISAAAPRILFSSSPIDLEEVTHINVRPTRYWLERFAEAGFAPVVGFDATFLCPHAMLLERSDEGRDDRSLAAFAEIVRQRLKVAESRQNETKTRANLQQELAELRRAEAEMKRTEAEMKRTEAELKHEMAELRRGNAELREQHAALRLSEAEERALTQREVASTQEEIRQARQLAVLKEAEIQRVQADAQSTEDALRRECAAAAQEHSALLQRVQAAETRLQVFTHTRAWRVARMLQRTSGWLPLLRRACRLVWWTCTLQLPRRLEVRRESIAIRQTGLFDDGYYRQTNPDLAMSGMDAALHFTLFGWKEGRKPNPEFDPTFYLDQHPEVVSSGLNPLLHYARHGRAEGRRPLPSTLVVAPAHQPLASARSMVQTHCQSWAPLPVFADRHAAPTLTIITDSVDADHLFGGVGTAMVVGATAARQMGARLRLVTRHAPADPAALGHIIRTHQVNWDGPTDFVHIPVGGDRPLPLGARDLVLTTSWWSTRAALGSVNAERVLYLLQEDERMFYPYGDERLRCAETLSEPKLRVLVNTRLLFDHLADGPDPLMQLRDRGDWFEPAFPAFPRPQVIRPRDGKRNFFFYARPNNDRNLYWRGLEVIDCIMREGVLPPSDWDIHFVGRELPDMALPDGVRPIVWAKLSWSKYAELVSRMDLGLCLMDTPHPSYPPLDLAASGAVVVTNMHGPKRALGHLSDNILMAPPSVAGLSDALRRGVDMAHDLVQRAANCAADHIPRAWEAELSSPLDRLLAGKN